MRRSTFRGWVALIMALLSFFTLTGAHAGCTDNKRLVGVNLAGAEFGHTKLPGLVNKDYVYPNRADMTYFRALGMTMIRLPVKWERLQWEANGPLNASELDQLRRTIGWAEELDLCVLIDLHNYGKYHDKVLGSSELPASALTDLWLKLQQKFSDPNLVALGLMNEPAAIAVPAWITIAQQTVLALRHAGAKNLILVASGRWSGAHEWAKTFDGVTASNAFRSFQDPLNNFAIELHQYADANYSGTSTTCIEPARLRETMDRVSAWAKQEKKRLFLGEFGVASSPECLSALRAMLVPMQDTQAWLGWTYWSAGGWWGNYPFSVHPKAGAVAPQLTVLREFLN